MIVGAGVDLIENSRFERELATRESADEAVFTNEELNQCATGRRPALRYAACFAAKEAALKALGVGLADIGMLREAEVIRTNIAEYRVAFHGRLKMESERLGVKRINLSITRNAKQTIATVILES